jgi:hypothetical protein
MLDQLEEENRSVRPRTKPISFDRSLHRCLFQFAELSCLQQESATVEAVGRTMLDE